jgi:hypothetical protein
MTGLVGAPSPPFSAALRSSDAKGRSSDKSDRESAHSYLIDAFSRRHVAVRVDMRGKVSERALERYNQDHLTVGVVPSCWGCFAEDGRPLEFTPAPGKVWTGPSSRR